MRDDAKDRFVSVPLRGMGCDMGMEIVTHPATLVSVPLRGMGCDATIYDTLALASRFPSPYGAWVVTRLFIIYSLQVSVPLRGMGCDY